MNLKTLTYWSLKVAGFILGGGTQNVLRWLVPLSIKR